MKGSAGWLVVAWLAMAAPACGGSDDDEAADAAPTTPQSIAEYLDGRTTVMFAHMVGGTYGVDDSAWVAEVETFDTSTTPGLLTADYRIVDPGTSGLSVGDVACTIEFEVTVSDIPTLAPTVRQKFVETGISDSCGFGNDHYTYGLVRQVLATYADGSPKYVADWTTSNLAGLVPSEITTNIIETDHAKVYLVCPEGAQFGDADCRTTCQWPITGFPSGSACDMEDFN